MVFFSGDRKPSKQEVEFVCENITFIFKSFERQYMAKELYWSIQKYYPGVRGVIADDSSKPLTISDDDFLTIIQMPFNSGLSKGLNEALARVKTPYVVRLDDDELLTLRSHIDENVTFLERHKAADFVGMLPKTIFIWESTDTIMKHYYEQTMKEASKKLLIPHWTMLDEKHIVLGKIPNNYVARTEVVCEIGFDNCIRMLDHHEFFYRVAGHSVATADLSSIVFHRHNLFMGQYEKYRNDVYSDVYYIKNKTGISTSQQVW